MRTVAVACLLAACCASPTFREARAAEPSMPACVSVDSAFQRRSDPRHTIPDWADSWGHSRLRSECPYPIYSMTVSPVQGGHWCMLDGVGNGYWGPDGRIHYFACRQGADCARRLIRHARRFGCHTQEVEMGVLKSWASRKPP